MKKKNVKKNLLIKNPVSNFFGPHLSVLLGFSLSIDIIFVLWSLINGAPIGRTTFFVFRQIVPIIFLASFFMSALYFIVGIFGHFSKKNKDAKQWMLRGLVGMILMVLLFHILLYALSMIPINPHKSVFLR